MSRTKPSDTERAELLFACSFCQAAPQEWCVTSSGASAKWLHGARWWQVRAVVELSGWADMYDDVSRRRGALRHGLRQLRADCAGHANLDGPNVVQRIDSIIAEG